MENIGKQKCEILKEIRRQIAESEGIKYAPAKCNHKGECQGTCPVCEAEVEYLEQEIARKHGRAFRPAAAAAAVMGSMLTAASLVSCGGAPLYGDSLEVDSTMVGMERELSVPIEDNDSTVHWENVKVTITEEMIGDDMNNPDSASALWQAIEVEKAKLQKK